MYKFLSHDASQYQLVHFISVKINDFVGCDPGLIMDSEARLEFMKCTAVV